MHLKIRILLATFLSTILVTSTMGGVAFAQQTGFYPDEIVYFEVTDEDLALSQVKAGLMDHYLWHMPPAKAAEALKDPKVGSVKASGSYIDLIFNPAPKKDGLNPFSLKEFRQTVNLYLIDREFITKEIYKGFALPMYTAIKPTSPDYIHVAELEEVIKAKSDTI